MALLTELQPLPPAARVSLSRPDADIYRNVEPVPWPGVGGGGAPANQSGPNAAMVRLGLEQQKEQRVAEVMQRHGTDYEGAIQEVAQFDPDLAFKMKVGLENGRKASAERYIADSDASLKDMEWARMGIELSIRDPSKYPLFLQDIAKKPGGSRYLQYAPDPNDPDLVQKLQNILPIFPHAKEFIDITRDAAKDIMNGDTQLAVAKAVAASTTPERKKIVDGWIQGGGYQSVAKMWQTPEDAQAFVAQAEAEKAKKTDEKSVPVVRLGRDGKTVEQWTGSGWAPAGAEIPKGAHFYTPPAATGGNAGSEKKRGVTAGDANKIAEYNSSLADLDILEKTIGPGATGIAAQAGAALPNWATNLTGWGTGAKSRQATIDLVKQVIGKALEGGVLRKEDEVKYAKILPTIGDAEGVVRTKIKGLRQAIQQKREEHFAALEDAGYDVSKFRTRQQKTGGPGPQADPLGIR